MGFQLSKKYIIWGNRTIAKVKVVEGKSVHYILFGARFHQDRITVRAVGKTILLSIFATNVVVGDQNCAQCIEGSSPHLSTCPFLHLLEIFPTSSRYISSIFLRYFLYLLEIFTPSSRDISSIFSRYFLHLREIFPPSSRDISSIFLRSFPVLLSPLDLWNLWNQFNRLRFIKG